MNLKNLVLSGILMVVFSGLATVTAQSQWRGPNRDGIYPESDFNNLQSGFVLKDGHVYGSAHIQPKWFCIDAKTGQTKYIAKELGGGPVIFADGLFYCYAEKDGEMALAEGTPEQFSIFSKFKVPLGTAQHWAHPVIAGGKLYVRHNNALMVYDIRKQ